MTDDLVPRDRLSSTGNARREDCALRSDCQLAFLHALDKRDEKLQTQLDRRFEEVYDRFGESADQIGNIRDQVAEVRSILLKSMTVAQRRDHYKSTPPGKAAETISPESGKASLGPLSIVGRPWMIIAIVALCGAIAGISYVAATWGPPSKSHPSKSA